VRLQLNTAACGSLSAVLAIAPGLPCAANAQAPSPVACEAVRVRVDGPVPEAWSAALSRLCATLATRGDLDPQAALVARAGPAGDLHLSARLRDGRSAERDVDSEAALVATAEALLLLPLSAAGEAPPPSAATTQPASSPGPRAPVTTLPDAATPEETEPPPVPPEGLVHLRLGVNLIGHVAGTPAYIGGGFSAVAGVRFGRIVFEVAPQWEAEQVSARERLADFEMHNFGVSALLGVRVWNTREGAVEAGAGALFLAETQTYRPVSSEVGGTLIDGQLAAFTRILWGESSLRWSARFDAALALARLAKEAHIRENFPPLPSVSVGVAFGVHWESQ
jgi:hypothetical protein